MALTIPRWIAATIGGCLILSAYFLRPGAERVRTTEDRQQLLQERARVVRTLGTGLADRLVVLHLRDSVLASLRPVPAGGSIRVRLGVGVSGRLREGVERLVKRAAPSGTAATRVPVDIAFVLDDGAPIRGVVRNGWNETDYVLPSAIGSRCLVLVRYSSVYNARNFNWLITRWADNLMGPCAFYEQFGAPGPNVSSWLRSGGWSLGVVNVWTRADAAWSPSWYESTRQGFFGAAGWPLRDHISTTGYRCVTGDSGSCRDIVTGATGDLAFRPTRSTWSGGIVSGGYRYRDRWALGPNQDALLAEMVRTLGPDRFQKFWSSPLPPAEAFRAATGQDIGLWTLDWARRMYGEQARGPGLSGLAAGVGILVALVALGAAMAAAQRRQVA